MNVIKKQMSLRYAILCTMTLLELVLDRSSSLFKELVVTKYNVSPTMIYY